MKVSEQVSDIAKVNLRRIRPAGRYRMSSMGVGGWREPGVKGTTQADREIQTSGAAMWPGGHRDEEEGIGRDFTEEK